MWFILMVIVRFILLSFFLSLYDHLRISSAMSISDRERFFIRMGYLLFFDYNSLPHFNSISTPQWPIYVVFYFKEFFLILNYTRRGCYYVSVEVIIVCDCFFFYWMAGKDQGWHIFMENVPIIGLFLELLGVCSWKHD